MPRTKEYFARKSASFGWAVVRTVLIIGISFYILYPLLTKFSMAFMATEDLYDITVRLVPRTFSLENLKLVWEQMNYPTSLLNTLWISVLVTLLQLSACLLIGYGFARFEFPLRGFWFAMVLLTLLIPPQVIIIPLYLRFNRFDVLWIAQLLTGKPLTLINSLWPSVLMAMTGVGIRNGLFIYIIRQFFRNAPKELEEASLIDGAGIFKTFVHIMLPSARPIMTTVFLFSFVWQWTDVFFSGWFMPRMSILSLKLDGLLNSVLSTLVGQSITTLDQSYSVLLNSIGCLLVILPLLILYIFAQRAFVESIERSGIVG